MQRTHASFSCCRALYPTPPNHHDSSILFPTFLSERLIYTALSLGLLEPHLLTCSLSLTSSSCCGSLFSLALCLRGTFFPPDPPQSRRTCSLIHVSVLRLFFSSLVNQVTLLTLVSPRFLSARGSSFPLLSPQPCSPTSYSILMERCPLGTFTPLRHFQIQRVWYRLSFIKFSDTKRLSSKFVLVWPTNGDVSRGRDSPNLVVGRRRSSQDVPHARKIAAHVTVAN